MLSHRDVDSRIASGKLKLWYSFLPNPSGAITFYEDDLPVDLSQPGSPATQFYRKNMYSSHLHLTTGPIVKTHHRLVVPGRKLFRQQKRCFDLREQNNAIVVAPFELLSVATNERIALDGRTAALVTPRITCTDSGLLLSAAYIDPYYEGIMRVVICNTTPERQTLRLLEPIAQCFFFDLSTDVAESYKREFPQKSVFYGQNWKLLLDSDGDPFPRRKAPILEPSARDKFAAAISNLTSLNTIQKAVTVAGVLTVAGLLVALGRLQAVTAHFESVSNQVVTLNGRLGAIAESVPLVGSRDIVVPVGVREGSVQFTIGVASRNSPHLWLAIDPASATTQNDVRLSYSLMPAADSSETTIEITARPRVPPGKADLRVPVIWMVVR
ncbi:MAG TPA: hypothetical protein VMU48_20575 [Terracidiphilus sp.]|nr:hypothetical protein [Terracidiphilus sp.]